MNRPRHFLSLTDLTRDELNALLARASEMKRDHYAGKRDTRLAGRVLGMIFEKSSTRTRVSFEAAMAHFGGSAIFLSPADTQLGRGEPVEDTARVLSRMVDCITVRTFEHEKIERFAAHSRVPVINALTDLLHPCQLLADLQTFIEARGDIRGRKVAWIGDGNNMCNTWLSAAHLLDFRVDVACPKGYEPAEQFVELAGAHARVLADPLEAARDADLVVTDVWASMGQEREQVKRGHDFAGYEVNARVMAAAGENAVFMHCLPAHRGEEVSAEVIDGPQSVVWEEAENRMHAQKALIDFLLR